MIKPALHSKSPAAPAGWLRGIAPALAPLAATLVFWKIYVIDRFTIAGPFIFGDIYSQLYPKFIYGSMVFKEGAVPLWNPYEYCGMPFLAIMQAQVLYPLKHLIFLLFSPAIAIQVFIAFHLFLNGVFALAFFRSVKLSASASMVAALVWAFSAPLALDSIYHPGRLSSIAWFPFCLVSLHLLLERGRWRWSIFLAAGVAMQFLAGYPPIFLASVALLFLYFFFFLLSSFFSRAPSQFPRVLLPAAFSAGLWFFLVAAQLFPFLEFMGESHRSAGVTSVLQLQAHSLLPLSGLFFKSARGGGAAPFFFMGCAAFILLLYGLVLSRRSIKYFFAAAAILTVVVAMGDATPVSPFLQGIPPFKYNRYPIMWSYLAFFFLAGLVGLGIDYLKHGYRESEGAGAAGRRAYARKWIPVLALMPPILLLVLCPGADIFEAAATVLTGIIILFFFLVRRRWLHEVLVIAMLVLLTAIYVQQAAPLRMYIRLPDGGIEDLREATGNAAIKSFIEQDRYARVYSSELVVLGKYLFSGVQLANGFEGSLRLRRTAALMDLYQFRREFGSTDLSTFISYPGFLDLMGTRLLFIAHERAAEFSDHEDRYAFLAREAGFDAMINKRALRRCFLVHAVEIVQDEQESFGKIRDGEIDPSKVVLLEEPLPASAVIEESSVDEEAPMIAEYKPEDVVIEANPQAGGFLVLTDSYYPGWRAYDNGIETKIYAADYLFRAVYLSPGRHVVRFIYRPASFTWGARLSLAGWGLLLLYFLFWASGALRRKFRRRSARRRGAEKMAEEASVSD